MKKHSLMSIAALLCMIMLGTVACQQDPGTPGVTDGTTDAVSATEPAAGADSQPVPGDTETESVFEETQDSESDSETATEPAPETEPEPLPTENPTVSITHPAFGAKGDGKTNDRGAIQKAIDYVADCGGGVVVIPAGSKPFLTGNLFLKSNVELRFEKGATLKQSPDPDDYAMLKDGTYEAYRPKLGHDSKDVVWGHTWFENYPLIYAGEGSTNVKVTGKGIIDMTRGDGRVHGDSMTAKPENCDITLHICPIGFYRVDGFEISDITIQNYSTYAVMPYTCWNGMISGITVKGYNDSLNTDGISLMNCQNIRITGCHLTTGDDALYVFTSYDDPRGGTWWSSDNPQPSKNIEIDHNTTWSGCKGFGLILWGNHYSDLSQVEISDLYVHDNTFSSMGIWNEDYFNDIPGPTPVKNVRFDNNKITPGVIEDNLFTTPISNMTGSDQFPSMTDLQNGDFQRTGEAYWILGGGAAVLKDGDNYYGKLDYSHEIASELFQGLSLKAGREYSFTAHAYTSGVSAMLFIRDAATGEIVASKVFSNTESGEMILRYIPTTTANYQVGILESGDAGEGWCVVDDLTLTYDKAEQSIFVGQYADQGFGSGGHFVLGTKFSAKVDGIITKVRIYTAAGEDGVHQVSIWDPETLTVIAGPYEWVIQPGMQGWQSFTLPEICHIDANKVYMVSVSNTAGDQLYAQSAAANAAITSGDLVVMEGSGYYNYYGEGQNMPYIPSAMNYLRDIVFLPAEQTIFTDEIPDDFTNDARYELGTKFQVKVSGYITKVRIYTSKDESGTHKVSLWDAENNRLLAGPFDWVITAGTEGWQIFELPEAVHISADRDYIISVSNGEDKIYPRATGVHSFVNPICNRDLITYADSGTYSTTLGSIPLNLSPVSAGVNYLRDVVFVADKNPVLEAVEKYVLEDLYNACQDTAEDSYAPADWALFQAALAEAKRVLEDPSATQAMVDAAHDELLRTANLTREQTIFTTQTPTGQDNFFQFAIGTKFKTTVDGQITKVRIYALTDEQGIHYVSIWNAETGENLTGMLEWNIEAGEAGWRTFDLDQPLDIKAHTHYIVSVTCGPDKLYPMVTNGLAESIVNRDLIAVSGMYSYATMGMPDNAVTTSYLRDVVFIAAPTVAAEQSILTDQTPHAIADNMRSELGMQFSADKDGQIIAVRIYAPAGEGGEHGVSIWDFDQQIMLTEYYTWTFTSGTAGWKTFVLPTPLHIEAGKDYLVSVSNSADKYYVSSNVENGMPFSFNTPIVHGDLTGKMGYFSPDGALGVMPTLSYNAGNYYRDVVFVSDASMD